MYKVPRTIMAFLLLSVAASHASVPSLDFFPDDVLPVCEDDLPDDNNPSLLEKLLLELDHVVPDSAGQKPLSGTALSMVQVVPALRPGQVSPNLDDIDDEQPQCKRQEPVQFTPAAACTEVTRTKFHNSEDSVVALNPVIKNRTGKLFPCPYCPKEFAYKKRFEKHIGQLPVSRSALCPALCARGVWERMRSPNV